MDAEVRKRLKQEIDAVTRMRLELEELSGRVAALEGRHANGGSGFDYHAHVAARRRAAVELRRAGLSIAGVAKRLGVAVSTIQRDLEAVPHEPPDFITGRDGKRHPVAKRGRARA